MKRSRQGFALLLALAGVIVLAALAALANVSAITAIRESAVLRDQAQAEASRNALRERTGRLIARLPLASLLGQRLSLGGGDTALLVTEVATPWFRLDVVASGVPVAAEFARAEMPAVSWCAGVVTGGATEVPAGAITIASSSACSKLLVEASWDSIASFDSSLAKTALPGAGVDTLLIVAGGAVSGVWRARRLLAVGADVSVAGVLIAPVVRIAAGATVSGIVVAADSVIVAAGGRVIADERAVHDALMASAPLRQAGRRGLLLPP